jgi:hypothetical protein
MWGSSPQSLSGDDMDSSSWYDRRGSGAGVYNMDHDSVCSDIKRKPSSGSSCSCSGTNSPTSHLSTLTASSAAAATAKLLSSHQSQQGTAQMPAWWGVQGDRASPRSSTASFAKQQGQSFGLSVPEEVPEDGVMAFRTYSQEFVVDRGLEGAAVDIFDAMRMLN